MRGGTWRRWSGTPRWSGVAALSRRTAGGWSAPAGPPEAQVRVWDVASRRQMLLLTASGTWAGPCAISPDGAAPGGGQPRLQCADLRAGDGAAADDFAGEQRPDRRDRLLPGWTDADDGLPGRHAEVLEHGFLDRGGRIHRSTPLERGCLLAGWALAFHRGGGREHPHLARGDAGRGRAAAGMGAARARRPGEADRPSVGRRAPAPGLADRAPGPPALLLARRANVHVQLRQWDQAAADYWRACPAGAGQPGTWPNWRAWSWRAATWPAIAGLRGASRSPGQSKCGSRGQPRLGVRAGARRGRRPGPLPSGRAGTGEPAGGGAF